MFSRRLTTVVTVLLVALVTVALVASALPVFAQPAGALPMHARLVSTTPEDGASVPTVREVSMTFSEDVDERFLEVAVDGPEGDEADGPPSVAGGTVTQALLDPLPPGEHTVTYRVVSVDGHPVSGSFSFTSTATPEPTESPEPSATSPVSSAPATTAPAPDASPATTPTASEGGTPGWVVPTALAALVALLLAGGALFGRGGRAADDEHLDSSA